MTIGFLLRTGPYTSQNTDTCYHLTMRLLKRGHQVKIFLYEDGVLNVNRGIKSPQERNIGKMMQELADAGVEIKVCGTCAGFRGVTRAEVIQGARLAGTAVLAGFLAKCDRFISLGF